MHLMEIPSSLQVVGRAGSGVNNIPVKKLSDLAIPVFNAPGANANAVKELAIAAILICARNIHRAIEFVEESENLLLENSKIAITGEYVEDSGTVAAYVLLTFELGVLMGAALSMIPKDTVDEEITGRTFNEEVKDNLHEILNIAASLLNNTDKAHHKFSTMSVFINEPLESSIEKYIDSATGRRDFTVAIPGYGEGVLSFILLEGTSQS